MKKRNLLVAMLVVSLFLTGLDCSTRLVVQATSTQDKINQAQDEKNEIEDKIEENNDNLLGLKGVHQSLKGELNSLNEQLTQVSDTLEDLENLISEKEKEIEDAQFALEQAIADEENQYENMVIRVRAMYEQNDTSYLNAIINAGSIADMLNVADYFEKIAAFDRQKLAEYQENHALIEEQKTNLEQEKVVLDNLKVEAEAEKSKIAGLISQTSNSISAYADQISDAEQKALEYEAELKKKEEDIAYLKKVLAEEQALSAQAANSTWRDISEVSFADGDRTLLANLIYCEAGGEPYDGQVAVGAVVINRVLSSVFPDTVSGVIYQKKQFSPVASGRLAMALAANRATPSCYQAADAAMSGQTNVGNCLFFRTPIEGLTGISIGGHIFY